MESKILIIDDNEKNIRLMELLLKQVGYTVVSAASGAKGVGVAQREHPDLILMDIQMPDMDGFQATQQIMANELTHNIPVIGFSAYASQTSRERALRMGMAGFFEKPVNRELFVAQIRAFLPSPR